MAGLFEDKITTQDQGMPPQQPGTTGQALPGNQPATAGQLIKATPDQQRIYDMYVGNGLILIHDKGSRNNIINMLKRGKPVDAVAETTLQVMARVDASAESQGMRVPDEVKLHGGNEIMGEIIMIGEAAKAIPKMKDEEREAAFRIAVGRYMQSAYRQGKISSRDLISAADKVAASRPELNLERDATELAPYIKKSARPMPAGPGGASPPVPEGAPQTPMPEEQLRR